jgi:dTDP-6-deoxy-L-talose 4-dehydrogenase (NAD+)
LKKTDYFIHLASYGVVSGSNDWNQCFNINVSQYLQILLAAVNLGVKNYFIVGSCFEYGRSGELHTYIPVEAVLLPTSAYAALKVAATSISYALSVQHNLEMIIASPFHVYGEGEDQRRFWPSLVNAAKQGEVSDDIW